MSSALESYRIDVHAHYIAPAYREALIDAEMWMIGGIPYPTGRQGWPSRSWTHTASRHRCEEHGNPRGVKRAFNPRRSVFGKPW